MKHHSTQTAVATDKAQAPGIWADFAQLVKFRLTALVLFSAGMAYAIAAGAQFNALALILLLTGGFLVTGASNAINQVLERDFDRLMRRTANRPLAAGRMTVSTAVLLAGLMALVGISVLSVFNPWTGFIGMLSFISYAFVYTPMKRSTPLAVLVGAVPGALPLVIGTAAFEHSVSSLGLFLFALQFLWQFPHFWAVAWLGDEDYKRAGYQLLPTADGKVGPGIGSLSLVFCGLLEINALIGWQLDFFGWPALVLLTLLNAYFGWRCFQLYRDCTREAARRQMFASFLHLPLSLIVLLIDKL